MRKIVAWLFLTLEGALLLGRRTYQPGEPT